jgi:hypothetical protein
MIEPYEHLIASLHLPYATRARVLIGKRSRKQEELEMLDLIFIALVLVFFVFSFWYVRFCDRV